MVRFPPISAAEIQQLVSGKVLRGGGDHPVTELGEPAEVGPGGVAFIFSRSYLEYVGQTKASVLVIQSALAKHVGERISDAVQLCIECPDAYLGLAHFTQRIAATDPLADWQAGTTANSVHPTAQIDSTATLGPGAIVGARAVIGRSSVVLSNAVIGPETRIGAECLISPGAVLYPRTVLGDRVRIHANAVVGCDGFGYARTRERMVKICHLGKVVIGDDVEIGAGTTIDRGTIHDTIIETGTKIDNLVQIGHNAHIMAHATLCGQVGLAGNVTIGRGAILAGRVGVANKLKIGDRAVIGSMSGVASDVAPGTQVLGLPARPRREWWRLVALFERLPELFDRVKKLEGASE